MTSHVEPSRGRLAARCAAFALLAAGVAGCSTDVGRFERTGSIPPTRSAPPADVAYRGPAAPAAPVGRVESQPLPPSGGHAQPTYQSYPQQSSLPPPPSRYSSAPPAQNQPQPVQRAAAAPAPRTAAQPSGVHTVGRGDTLISVARMYRKTPMEVARANGMTTESKVRLGQRLIIPGVVQSRIRTAAPAPMPAQTQASAKPAQQAKPVQQAKPAQAPAPKPQAAAQPPKQPEKKTVTAQLGAPPSNLKPPSEQRVERAQVATPAQDTAKEAKDDGPTITGGAPPNFRWPARGRVIAGFGPKSNGQHNDGINLAVPEGTSIKAAEDGVVAYAGNELKGYGNLVLVRHANGYSTAYAHASELKVKRGDRIKRGQIIATAGQTGGVASPQLHFEVRKGATPVDPMPMLSGN